MRQMCNHYVLTQQYMQRPEKIALCNKTSTVLNDVNNIRNPIGKKDKF